MKFFQQLLEKVSHKGRGVRLGVFLAAAMITGAASVAFMWAFEFALHHRLDTSRVGRGMWVTTPLLFLASVEIIRRLAPFADGAGIPQTVFAAEHLNDSNAAKLMPLVSMKTMAVKVLALLLAVWAGASTGREGPTVHVAACLFVGVLLLARRVLNVPIDLRSAVIAGGAAGLAAAFNTPLAGVTFAIEELSADYFSSVKDVVLMSIIVAGITAQTMTGEYTYFGRLTEPPAFNLWLVVLIGITGGILGALFSTVLVKGRRLVLQLSKGAAARYAIPVVLAWAVLLLNAVSQADLLGPGNRVAQTLVAGEYAGWAAQFSLLKMLATLCTYWSGIAGGIFAPSLSIGAGTGSAIGHALGSSSGSAAVLGMGAFLSAAIQAPITAFVIIFEMTGHHQMLLPIMLTALIATLTARTLGARHLYQTLADSYGAMVGFETRPKKH